MLGKLFKYDFRWINKVMIIYYIIAIVLALLTRFVESIEQNLLIVIIDKILVATLISCFASITITVIIRIWVRFKINIYKDESYLTHTLPATKSQIFDSKMLASFLSIIIAVVIIIGCIAIVSLNESTIDLIKDTYNTTSQLFGKGVLNSLIVSVFLIIILEVIFMMQSGIFGIVVGSRANNYRALRSVLIGLMMYAFLSAFNIILLLIATKFNPALDAVYRTDTPSPEVFKVLIYFGLIVYAIYNLGYYLINKKILGKGVNVD